MCFSTLRKASTTCSLHLPDKKKSTCPWCEELCSHRPNRTCLRRTGAPRTLLTQLFAVGPVFLLFFLICTKPVGGSCYHVSRLRKLRLREVYCLPVEKSGLALAGLAPEVALSGRPCLGASFQHKGLLGLTGLIFSLLRFLWGMLLFLICILLFRSWWHSVLLPFPFPS